MPPLDVDERAELEALRARVAALETERADLFARANAAIAQAQERTYWLDRWRIDLNALMARPGAAEFRMAIRLARGLVRRARLVKRALLGR